MPFEWDDAKNNSNIQQHGIDFADIPPFFNGPILTDADDRVDYGENRWISMGLLGTMTIVVVWTDRPQDTIRIISARKANRYERQQFETYLSNRLGSFG